MQESTDPAVKELYMKRIFTQPFHEAFTSAEKGVDKMRKQLFAFHGDSDALFFISKTYQQEEKCRLKKIRMYTSIQLSFGVKKGSNYGEHIRRT